MMPATSRTLLIAAITAILSACGSPPPDTPATLVLDNVTLLTGIDEAPVIGMSVAIADDRVAAIYPTDNRPAQDGVPHLDLTGHTLLPGLINGHIHMTPNPDRHAAMAAMLRMGVTTLRDLGGNAELLSTPPPADMALPDLVLSAALFGGKFMDDPRVAPSSRPHAPGTAPWMRRIEPGDDLAAIMADAKSAGVTGVKPYASLEADTLAEIVDAAHAAGLKVWSHSVIFPCAPEDVVAAGPDEIIHAKGLATLGMGDIPDTFREGAREWTPTLDFAAIDPRSATFTALFADMRERGISLNPALIADGDIAMRERTLQPWQAAQRDWACDVTAAAAEAGVTLTAGTDYFGEPGLLFLELERLVECGLTPLQAIEAATANNAMTIGREAEIGTIAPGKRADILVVAGDPSGDISVLRETRLVLKNGAIVFDADRDAIP